MWIVKIMTNGKELFMDYGEFILHYHFDRKTLFRAHRIALDLINRNNPKYLVLDDLNHAHEKAIEDYLKARKEDYSEWTLERILDFTLKELRINGKVPREDIILAYKLNDHDVRPTEGAKEALTQLSKERNLHIISNLPHDSLVYELDHHKLRGFFKTITISCEVGYRKPHPLIYKEAMQRARTTPQESIFASHEEYEVEGARNVGMYGILAKNVAGVLNQLP